MTIVIRTDWECIGSKFYDLISGVIIPRKTRFYFKDKQGFYYIPEVLNERINRKRGSGTLRGKYEV